MMSRGGPCVCMGLRAPWEGQGRGADEAGWLMAVSICLRAPWSGQGLYVYQASAVPRKRTWARCLSLVVRESGGDDEVGCISALVGGRALETMRRSA